MNNPIRFAFLGALIVLGLAQVPGLAGGSHATLTPSSPSGPSSSTDSYVSVFSGTSGKLLVDRPVTVASTGQVSWPTGLGSFAQVQGPTDQDLRLYAPSGRIVRLGAGGADAFGITTSAITPLNDATRDLGTTGAKFRYAYVSGGTVPSVLTKSVTSASTTAVTTEETLWSYSLPAGTLASDGQAVFIRVRGYMAANTNNKTVALKFGSTTLHTFSATNSGLTWQIEALVQRSGATAQLTSGLRQHSGGFSTIHGSASETLANAITISLTGTNAMASAGDITFDAALVEFKP